MTPGEAIRKFCVDCVGSVYQTEDCSGGFCYASGKPCNFYKFRQGRGRPSVKIIRRECLFCMGNSSALVRECSNEKCALYLFRFGKNPNYSSDLAKNLKSTHR